MPTIVVVETSAGASKTLEAPSGGALIDICDRQRAPVPFSCRSASCATCQIEVVEGAELLEPPAEEEQDLLDVLEGPASSRLACQAKVKPGPGLLKIKPIGT